MYDTKCIFSAHITCMMHLPSRHRTGVKLSVARNEKNGRTLHIIVLVDVSHHLNSEVRLLKCHSSYSEVKMELFYLTQSWCFSMHRQKMKMLGR